MQAWTPWVVGILVSGIAIPLFIRLLPKAKLMAWVTPAAYKAGQACSLFLTGKLGRKAAESIEEGILTTLAATLYAAIDSFMKGTLYDNEERQPK